MSLSEQLRNKPIVGWSVAGVLFVIAAVLMYRQFGGGAAPAYSLETQDQDVVIRDRETGEEWTIKRGFMEAMLLERQGALDPDVGLPNPKTGTLTGFPRSDWEATIDRLNHDRDQAVRLYRRRPEKGETPAVPEKKN